VALDRFDLKDLIGALSNLSEPGKEFILRLSEQEPDLRKSPKDLLKDEYLLMGYDELYNCR